MRKLLRAREIGFYRVGELNEVLELMEIDPSSIIQIDVLEWGREISNGVARTLIRIWYVEEAV